MLTKEELQLPDDIAGTAYAINKQSSDGLLVLNPGHVDPGYRGPLSMVALNLRRVPLPLCLDEAIFTVVFNQLEQSANPAYSAGAASIASRELAVNKKVVEKSMVSISDLIAMDSPFVTENRVRHLILSHWCTWVVSVATLIAAVFAVMSVVQNMTSKDQASRFNFSGTEPSVTPQVRPSQNLSAPPELSKAPAPAPSTLPAPSEVPAAPARP